MVVKLWYNEFKFFLKLKEHNCFHAILVTNLSQGIMFRQTQNRLVLNLLREFLSSSIHYPSRKSCLLLDVLWGQQIKLI